MVRHWGAGSLAEHAALAELNANTAAIANGYGLCLVGVPGGRRPLQSGQLYGVREPVQSLCPQPGCPDPA